MEQGPFSGAGGMILFGGNHYGATITESPPDNGLRSAAGPGEAAESYPLFPTILVPAWITWWSGMSTSLR